MAAIAGLQDFRQQGPPADIGTFILPTTIVVFDHTFDGTTRYCAVRMGERGWILVSYDLNPRVVINATIAALTTGGEVTLAYYGTWSVDASIVDAGVDNITLRGLGRSTVLQLADVANVDVIHLTGVDGWIITDLKVDVNKANQTGVNEAYAGIRMETCSEITVERCWVLNAYTNGAPVYPSRAYGILFSYCVDCEAIGNRCENNDYGGIGFYSRLADGTDPSLRCIAANNICWGNDHSGIQIGYSDYCIIESNICRANTTVNIISHSGTYNNVVGNICLGEDSCSIGVQFIDTSNFGIISNNRCIDHTTYGIKIESSSHSCLIEANFCRANDSSGIYILASDQTVVVGNISVSNGAYGIALGSLTDRTSVECNYTIGNTSGCARVDNANCNNNMFTNNQFDEGDISDVGTNTRAWLNYDPSANAFITTINPPQIEDAAGVPVADRFLP